MDILTSGERLKLVEHMHGIRYMLQDWVFVQIQMSDEPAYTTSAVIDSLKQQFGSTEGKIFICNQKEILMVANIAKPKRTMDGLTVEVKQKLPEGSCEVEVFPPNKDGLRRIELRLRPPQVSSSMVQARRNRQKNIFMVADDDMFMRSLMKKILGPGGDVIEISDGLSVVGEYLTQLPDILFLDIHLPGREGPQAMREILEADPDAYIVMLSADSSRDNVMASVSHGAHGFLAKPVIKEKVLEHVTKCPTVTPPRAAS